MEYADLSDICVMHTVSRSERKEKEMLIESKKYGWTYFNYVEFLLDYIILTIMLKDWCY